MTQLAFDETWIVRDNPELDEKLPDIAKQIIALGIDYEALDEEEAPDDVVQDIIDVMIDHLDSYIDMTFDELIDALTKIRIACELCTLVSTGVLEETNNCYSLNQLLGEQ